LFKARQEGRGNGETRDERVRANERVGRVERVA